MSMLVAGGPGLTGLPVQPARIHCPPPRDDTLSRERLNSWLERAAAGRLGLIVAEAGFGKTTLLADWALHTTRMTAWYRLEPDDRDWLTFIRHIVASGREIDPAFAPDTFRLLHELESGGTNQRELTASLAREVSAFGTGSARGLTLILDDYHAVDGFAETEPIVRALLDRTAPGFSMVVATRATPRFSLGRLRARGGVMTLEGPDLCFDVEETSRLFRDAYQRPLDEDVVVDLVERTEGWAALLTLVRTGLDEPGATDPRALVAQLDTSRGDLYDFLAEEMLATLAPEHQQFLARVALLTAVDVPSAMLVDDRPADSVAASIAESERLGLLTRPDRTSAHRFHPLVREFLEAHLTAEIGPESVRELHRLVANATELTDWYAAAWHYRAADDPSSAARVIDAAIPTILAVGQYERTRTFLDGTAGSLDRPAVLIVKSRMELEHGNLARATQLATRANSDAIGSPLAGVALLNLAASRSPAGFDPTTVRLAAAALETDLAVADREVAEASLVVSATQEEGGLEDAADYLASLAVRQDGAGHTRYAGVTRLNQALLLLWSGRPAEAIQAANRSMLDLAYSRSSVEWVAAHAVRTAAMVQLGNVGEVEKLAALLDTAISPTALDEGALETARLFGDYGSLERAEGYLARVSPQRAERGYQESWAATAATLAFRRGDLATATSMTQVAEGQLRDVAGSFRVRLTSARILVAASDPRAGDAIDDLHATSIRQQSRLEQMLVALLRGAQGVEADAAIGQLLPEEGHLMSALAEECVRMLPALRDEARGRIQREAEQRPERWSSALRLSFLADPRAASLLARIGNADDAREMRAAAPSRKWLRPLAAEISRRLAPHVLINDLGPVSVRIGDAGMDRTLRRKVLGLLCFISSRPGMAATRDEALEAIWPDLGPDTAVNSLHQTIYFLRRVFEPTYKEGISAGYVAFDGEVISLDADLVDSLSRRCWRLLAQVRAGTPASIEALVAAYRGTYALDFAYEDWAVGYRDNLHAAVLAAVETEVRLAVARNDTDLAISIAQQVLAVDRTADGIELELLRAYKIGGRHAAAAEQYAHYASYIRGELGAEPPPYSDI